MLHNLLSKKFGSLLLVLAIMGTICFSSYLKPGNSGMIENWAQMLNTSNSYYGTWAANNGNLIDTVVNTGTIDLVVAKRQKGVSQTDTFTADHINGIGTISLTAVVLKCTGSPTVICTPEESLDGINYAAIPGATVYTISPTSTTVPIVVKWPGLGKYDRHYDVHLSGSTSSTFSVQAQYYFQANSYLEHQY